MRRLVARPHLLAAVGLACIVVLAGVGVGAFLLARDEVAGDLPPVDLLPVEVQGKTGYIDHTGDMVIEPGDFSGGQSFCEGLALVWVDGKAGFLDTAGNFAIPPQFEYAGDFHDGLSSASRGWEQGYIDKTGAFVIQIGGMGSGSSFSGGLAVFSFPYTDSTLFGYIDERGTEVISPRFAEALDFSEGVAAVGQRADMGAVWWGYIDKAGAWVVQPMFTFAGSFSEGLAAVTVGDSGLSWGYIDKSGSWVIEPQFAYAGAFSEGLAPFVRQYGYKSSVGYLDNAGGIAIEPAFDAGGDFSQGLAAVARQDESGELKWGYVDKSGEWVIQPQYAWADDFLPGGLARVGLSGEPLDLIGGAGRLYSSWPGQLDGYFSTSRTDMAYIDKTGKVVWQTPLE